MDFAYTPIFQALEESGIRYVVVGGVAVVLHGAFRSTLDLDMVIDPAPDESRRLMELFESLGLVPRLPVEMMDFANPTIRERWAKEKEIQVFTVLDERQPLFAIDLFLEPPIPFEELFARSEVHDHSQCRIRVASVDDLVRMKLLADRPKDRLDIYKLRTIQGLQKDDKQDGS